MNIKRGLFRIWVVVAFISFIPALLELYKEMNRPPHSDPKCIKISCVWATLRQMEKSKESGIKQQAYLASKNLVMIPLDKIYDSSLLPEKVTRHVKNIALEETTNQYDKLFSHIPRLIKVDEASSIETLKKIHKKYFIEISIDELKQLLLRTGNTYGPNSKFQKKYSYLYAINAVIFNLVLLSIMLIMFWIVSGFRNSTSS